MKKKSTMNPGVTSSKMPINLVEEYKKAKGLQNGGVAKYKRGSGLDLPVISSVKPAVHKTKRAQNLSKMKIQFNKQRSRAGISPNTLKKFSKSIGVFPKVSGPFSSMEEMRKAKGFKPGESASEFNKRRKALSVAKNVASKTRIGKIALGVGAAGVAAQQYLKSKMKKKDEPKKKMGGGMMQKPMGYSKGGGYDSGNPGKLRDIVTKYAGKFKSKDRLTERDIETANKILKGGRGKALRSTQEMVSRLKKFDSAKKMGGGMMNKPMGYTKGTMVKAKGCKLGRTRPTKIT